MKLLLLNQSRDKVSEAWLRKWVRGLPARLRREMGAGVARKLKLPTLGRRELVLVFVNSGEMKRLNNLYRQKNYATDVLSFESADEGCIGELVICLPVVRAQSKRTGLSASGELGYMIVHGVLHLLGYDHETVKDEAEMFALQDRVFASLESSIGLK